MDQEYQLQKKWLNVFFTNHKGSLEPKFLSVSDPGALDISRRTFDGSSAISVATAFGRKTGSKK